MNQFAKLFQYDDIGQVLVVIDQSEGEKSGPEVRFSFTAPGLGVCSIKFNFPDTEEGWDKAEECFNTASEITSYEVVRPTIDKFAEAFKVDEAE